jgi:DNA-binding XRE family transcriptional regulator
MGARESLPFEVAEAVKALGQRVRVARVRRQLRQEELAQKCQVTRKTIASIEKGGPGIAVGTVVSVLWALGLLDSMKAVANPDSDEHGKILEAARLKQRVRTPAPVDNDF